jgi:hypothetical protein
VYAVSPEHRAAVDEILTSARPPHSDSEEKRNRKSNVDTVAESGNADGVTKGHSPPASVLNAHDEHMSHAPDMSAHTPHDQQMTSSDARTTHSESVPCSNYSDSDSNYNNTSSNVPPWRSHALIFDHSVLSKSGVPYTQVVQSAGEILVHFPYAYHSGVCEGFACWEFTCLQFVSPEALYKDANVLASSDVTVCVCM